MIPDSIDQNVLVHMLPPSQNTHWLGLEDNEELWLRKPYFALWSAVEEQLSEQRHTGLFVMGNPSIGKSIGGINTIAALSIRVSPGRLIVVLKSEDCHVFMNGKWHEAPGELPLDRAKATSAALRAMAQRRAPGAPRPELLLLIDVKAAEPIPSFDYQSWFVTNFTRHYVIHCVLLTSELSSITGFEKDFPNPQPFYMPTWSLQALEQVGKTRLKCSPGVEIRDRFYEVGGIVRWFAANEDFLFRLDQARKAALSVPNSFTQRSQFSAVTSKLFQLVPSSNHRRFSVSFLCDAARKLWFDARRRSFGDDAAALETSSWASLAGPVFLRLRGAPE